MAKGVVLKSGSYDAEGEEARQEKLEEVIENAGYEPAEPEAAAGPEGEAAAETFPAPRKSRRERAVERATAPLLERIKQLEAGRPGVAQAEAVDLRPKPRRADFADDETFEDALIAWGNAKFSQEKAVANAQAIEQQHIERSLRNYNREVQQAKTRYPDWDELKAKFEADDVFIGNGAQVALLQMDNGVDVTHHLMRNPDKAAALGRMASGAAFAEVVRLSERLKTGERRPGPRVPAPVRTVSTAGSGAVSTPADVAARPNYPGKARDFRKALAER